jgi:hypothetical protein
MATKLSGNASLLYAELMQKVGSTPHIEEGSFVSKMVKGTTYWYHQSPQVLGQRKQVCIGRETPELLEKIELARHEKDEATAILSERKRLVAMLTVAGATSGRGRAAKVIESVARAGLFTHGGILVGSYAFSCYGNMLGVSFSGALARTEDVDFSLDRNIPIGVPRNLLEDLRSVEPGLREPKSILPAVHPFELVAQDGFKIEFLTPKLSPADNVPTLIEPLSIHAQPLDYMDYLMEGVQDAVILYGAGIPVKVPDPARFALHKLAVSQLREIGSKTKSDKDVAQATAILEVLIEDTPGIIAIAADALADRNDMMSEFVRRGAQRLPESLAEEILVEVPELSWDTSTGAPRMR